MNKQTAGTLLGILLTAFPTFAQDRIDELVSAGGAADARVRLAFGVLVAGGGEPDGVNIRGRLVGSRPGEAGPSVLAFEPQPVAAEAQ